MSARRLRWWAALAGISCCGAVLVAAGVGGAPAWLVTAGLGALSVGADWLAERLAGRAVGGRDDGAAGGGGRSPAPAAVEAVAVPVVPG